MAYTTGVGSLASSAVKTDLGTTSMVLLWVSFASMTIVGLGLVVMILSIQILDLLTDEGPVVQAARESSTMAEKSNVQPNFQQEPVPMRHPRWDDGDE